MIDFHPLPRTDRNWIRTATGRKFWPFAPEARDISLTDIAHHLSQICRWTGATLGHCSVAQHCVLASRYVAIDTIDTRPGIDIANVDLQLWALFHDAAEAYLNDWSRPVKRTFNELTGGLVVAVEKHILSKVAERFRLPWPMPAADIERIDRLLYATERRDLMRVPDRGDYWDSLAKGETIAHRIVPWPANLAQRAFIERYRHLRWQKRLLEAGRTLRLQPQAASTTPAGIDRG